MLFFELLLGIGVFGTVFSFALVMFLERKDSIEEKIASGTMILCLIIALAGAIGLLV
jgi:hypothetical protein